MSDLLVAFYKYILFINIYIYINSDYIYCVYILPVYIQTFEETSGCVRPERVNKWPNAMTDI
jgi:hypothetical protein